MVLRARLMYDYALLTIDLRGVGYEDWCLEIGQDERKGAFVARLDYQSTLRNHKSCQRIITASLEVIAGISAESAQRRSTERRFRLLQMARGRTDMVTT